MGKFVRKCLLFSALLVTLVAGIGAFILFGLPPQFNNTYQHALYLQVRSLSRIKSPKVVVMGDSSVPFSLDSRLMSRLLDKPVQTLGIHSGTGIEYILNLSKSTIRRGDIMVLELPSDDEDDFSPAIVLTACENHFDMYRGFTLDDWNKVARYYPTYLLKKVKYDFHDRDQNPPSYSIRSFGQDGNYDYQRIGCRLPSHLLSDERDTVFDRKDFSDSLIQTLNDYNSYCRQRKATFLISFVPFLNESLVSHPSDFGGLQTYLAGQLKAPIITKLSARDLPRRYFYDNVNHCNTQGAEKVTSDLASDILRYLGRKVVAAKQPTGKSRSILNRSRSRVLPAKKAPSRILPRRLASSAAKKL